MSRGGIEASDQRPPRGVTPTPKTRRMIPAYADVGGRQDEVALDEVELEVVHPHDLHAGDVDDLLVEEVPREEDLVLLRGAVDHVRAREPGADGAVREDGDVVPRQDEALEPLAQEEARHAREGRLFDPVSTTRSLIRPTGSRETSRTGRFRNSETK